MRVRKGLDFSQHFRNNIWDEVFPPSACGGGRFEEHVDSDLRAHRFEKRHRLSGLFFSYTEAGQRKQKRCRTVEAAKAEALKVIRDQTDHQPHQREISLSEFADWSSAMQMLARHPRTTLTQAVAEWSSAQDTLAGRGTLADATAAFLRVADESKLPAMTVPSMVEKFIEAKTNEGLSAFYVGDIKHKLNRFARAFRGHIGSVRSEEITQWLSKQGGGRNANNLRAAVATLFSFAREHGFLAREKRHAAELVRKVKERPSPIGIYSPDELTAIMKHAPSRLVAPLAIAAFAGLRITEIFRLEWREVSLERGHIVVEAAKAKTASRRIVPILPALAAWLKVRAKKTGHVAPEYMNLENISRLFSGVCLDAGVTPQRNGFRHSFASYRLASVKSADQVALEMGNSPRKLFSNYRELVTEQDAERWFSVVPAKKKAGKRGGVPKKKPSAGKQS